ncbi:hypothetical protein FWF48_00160 [Candidatus Saccharibacteria bacterium]|nr:hypothetical protein [Candidatus Saccharibacteria bacterium]
MVKIYDIQFEDGADPEPHEIKTALFLKKCGKDVKFLAPKNEDHVKTPDIAMDRLKWEIKAPISSGSRVIEHALRSATKQSPNVIIDLRRCKLNEEKALRQLHHEGTRRGSTLKRLMVITKSKQIVDIK